MRFQQFLDRIELRTAARARRADGAPAACAGGLARFGFVLVCLLGVRPVLAQQPGAAPTAPPPIKQIVVEGNHNVPADQILQWFALRAGDRFDPARVSRATRELTAKHRFSDVRIEGEAQPDGIVLYIEVQEYPMARLVRLEGTKKLKEKDVRAVMKLSNGAFAGPAERGAERDRIAALYRDKGFFRAAVQDTLVPDGANAQDLVFRVTEGEKASVQHIVFEGNANVDAKKLRKQMETKEDGLLRGGELKMDVLQQDFDKITAYYRTQGYLDAQVAGHTMDVAPNGKDLTLRIRVQEGPRYTVGDVTWTGNTKFDDATLRNQVKLHKGEPFDESQYEATTSALYELYNDGGYIHFNATPHRDVRDRVVNLTYVLDEGTPAKINHITIVGNTKTEDKVILREFLILPGETFDRSKLMRSLREVYALGFFEDVNFERFTPRDDGNVDLELKVSEKQTGQLGAGAGYSAVNAVTGFFEVAETNLFGTGKRLSLRWEFSKHLNDINFSFSQPWLFDTPTSLGIDLYNSNRRQLVNAYYDDRRTGGAINLGRRLDFLDYTTAYWHYRAEAVELRNILVVPATDPNFAILELLRQQYAHGPQKTFATGITLRRNSTDNPFFPTSGSDVTTTTDLTGTVLGGDQSYLRQEATLAWFHRIGISNFSLMLKSQFGLLKGLQGRDVPVSERYRLGGSRFNAVRGYDDFEIVPAGNPLVLGGRAMSIFTSEIVYPFTPKLHGLLFFDAGNTWNSFREADLSLLRKGAGIGVRVEVPMLGTLGLDYGYGFDRYDSQGRSRDGWNLHFNFGGLF